MITNLIYINVVTAIASSQIKSNGPPNNIFLPLEISPFLFDYSKLDYTSDLKSVVFQFLFGRVLLEIENITTKRICCRTTYMLGSCNIIDVAIISMSPFYMLLDGLKIAEINILIFNSI
jgi:hypothetical protein